MKLVSFDLLAYGPFTGQRFDFSTGNPGLVVLHGANETGKSSALRALQALFYGFPGQTQDAFLHPYPALRVGATLQHSDGRVLRVLRRKGHKDTLLRAEDEKPVPEDTLAAFLGGVDQNLFATLFGIDHRVLAQGGESLLAQGGDVGQALFSAGLGMANLHQVLRDLDEEASALFSRSSKAAVVQALAKLQDGRARLKEAELSSRDWEEKENCLQSLRRDLALWQKEERELQEAKARLGQIRSAQPHLVARRQCQAVLEELSDVLLLPEEFGDRRKDALDRLRAARQEESRAKAILGTLREKVSRLDAPTAILDEKEVIEAFHRDVGVVEQCARDTITVGAQAKAQEDKARSLLSTLQPELPFEDVETLRGLQGLRTRVTELAKERGPLATALKLAEEGIPAARDELAEADRRLAETPETAWPDALLLTVGRAVKAGDLDDEIEKARSVFQEQARKLRSETNRLQPRPREEKLLDALEDLPVPPAETIQRLDGEWTKLAIRQETLADEQKNRRRALRECAEDVQKLLGGGEVPAEEEVLLARARRDAGWQHVLRAWEEGSGPGTVQEDFAPGQPLAGAYAESVRTADGLSDQLRREADRVLRYASLQADQKKLEEEARAASEEEEAIERKLEDLRREWLALWESCAITPRPPRDMRSWLSGFEVLRTRQAALAETKSTGLRLRERRDELVVSLREEIERAGGAPPEGVTLLSDALGYAQRLLSSIEAKSTVRADLKKSLPGLREALRGQAERVENARKALGEWQRRWGAVMEQLGLAEEAFDAEATELLNQLGLCFQALDAAKRYADRVTEMAQYTASFRQRVREFCKAMAPDLVDEPPVSAAVELHRRLSRAEQEKRLRDSYHGDLEENEKALRAAQTESEVAQGLIEALCEEAGCSAAEELAGVEERSTRLRAARHRLADAQAEIERLAFGTDREAFERAASETDPSTLPGQIQELTLAIEALETKIRAQHEIVGREEEAFKKMDGRGQAAAAAQEVQEAREEIRSAADRYVEVALASRVLREQIERFREAHEDPILRRAGEYLAQITRGRYGRLRADYGDKDERVLFGVRSDGSRVPVAAMSDGARDQVYLALRLASIEEHAARSEPVPFVVDDVLVHFDDRRAEATLGALSELAKTIQVILFTHHRQVAQAARNLPNQGNVLVCELEDPSG